VDVFDDLVVRQSVQHSAEPRLMTGLKKHANLLFQEKTGTAATKNKKR
jgi:hypothetical protein